MQQRQGWWLASDGKWYPPESHPNYAPPPPPQESSPTPVRSEFQQVTSVESELKTRSVVRRHRLPRKYVALIVVCVAYIVSPVDALPEAVLGPFGIPDDLVALLAAVGLFLRARLARSVVE